MPRDLTTTSYAILCQLALRPWRAYDLTKEMQRNLRYIWPRAESRIYDELKRLRNAGLAEATPAFVGRRRRMTYEITASGRQALSAWLEEGPSSGIAQESEALLHAFAATAPHHLHAAVQAIRSDSAELLAKAALVGQEYLDGHAPFQDHVRWRAHIHDFFASYALMLDAWAQRTERSLDAWQTCSESEIDRRALELIAAKVAQAAAVPHSAQPSK